MSALLRPNGQPLGRTIVDAAFLADPYPTYATLREAGPIHWSDEFFGGAWVLSRYDDVDAVMRDDTRFSAQRTGGWVMNSNGAAADAPVARSDLKDFQSLFARAMLFVDAPDHQRLRGVMNAGFRGASLERLQPFIDGWIERKLDAIEASGQHRTGFDFMAKVARPLPAQVIAAMMGIAEADRGDFIAWSDDLADFIGAPMPTPELLRRARVSLLAMARYFEQLTALRRREPGDDLVSRLVQGEADGLIQPGPELLAQCAMLLFAGHETTRNLLGNGLQTLLAHPAQWQRLIDEPALLPSAVRELLRFESPVQYTGRRVKTDLMLHGQLLQRGDLVVGLIGAANRDPARYAQPDALDVARRAGGLLSFGAGPHVCIGAALTLMEAQAVFAQVLRRWPGLRRVDAPPSWNENPVYRGLTGLRVIDGASDA